VQTCTFSVSSALFACLPHRSVHLHHHPCHASWHNILLVVPSTPSCSAFAIIHVYPIFPTYVFLPSHSLLTPPSNHASADQTVPDPPPVLSLSLLTLTLNFAPSCPYYYRSPTKMKRGFSGAREPLPHSRIHPLRIRARSIVISRTVRPRAAALYPAELYRFREPFCHVCPHKAASLSILHLGSTLRQ